MRSALLKKVASRGWCGAAGSNGCYGEITDDSAPLSSVGSNLFKDLLRGINLEVDRTLFKADFQGYAIQQELHGKADVGAVDCNWFSRIKQTRPAQLVKLTAEASVFGEATKSFAAEPDSPDSEAWTRNSKFGDIFVPSIDSETEAVLEGLSWWRWWRPRIELLLGRQICPTN